MTRKLLTVLLYLVAAIVLMVAVWAGPRPPRGLEGAAPELALDEASLECPYVRAVHEAHGVHLR
jgi:hypothetical protein